MVPNHPNFYFLRTLIMVQHISCQYFAFPFVVASMRIYHWWCWKETVKRLDQRTSLDRWNTLRTEEGFFCAIQYFRNQSYKVSINYDLFIEEAIKPFVIVSLHQSFQQNIFIVSFSTVILIGLLPWLPYIWPLSIFNNNDVKCDGGAQSF